MLVRYLAVTSLKMSKDISSTVTQADPKAELFKDDDDEFEEFESFEVAANPDEKTEINQLKEELSKHGYKPSQ
uniref:Uncharacterized protein n=1 Tax=Ditylenchus dipsaci TaxID=166011 RepID=A0A915DXC4_9BILA